MWQFQQLEILTVQQFLKEPKTSTSIKEMKQIDGCDLWQNSLQVLQINLIETGKCLTNNA